MIEKRNSSQILSAIERDCEAIAQLFRSCGSSRNFGLEQRQQLETLLRHRRRLIVALEALRNHGEADRMASDSG